ncbi:MAG: adenylate/guanylate cyclase domain-containing protein, partial [Planctomycetaceae bacterium]
MDCRTCGHANASDAAFCTSCGSPLETRCVRCGRSAPPDSRFCPGCGYRLNGQGAGAPPPEPPARTPAHLASKILHDRKLLEGERRTVTVLFADATGFTSLSEQVDPERVYDLMQGCLACMIDAVYRYEGAVTHYTGDGVMALFGAPIAHEDSARRAALAALDMQTALLTYAADVKHELPVECRFRVGLHTGPVIVGKISDDLDMDYTAIGDTVNLAARMEKAADPGSVYLTGTTYRAISDYVDCEPVGELAVKGKAEPVACYRAVRPKPMRTRFEAAAERGLTPLAGRGHELGLLRDFYRQACGGAGQVVFLSGEAGIGKSRLLLEFSSDVQRDSVTWLEGHCISFGKQFPYLPITDLLQRRFEIREGDAERAIIDRVEAATASWEASARATVPYLRFLLNVDPGDPN